MTALVLEPAARAWCHRLTRTLRVQQILRDGRPYLERYYVAGWRPHSKEPGVALFLHHFVASDAYDQVHSHPWTWSLSLILVGGYREERCINGSRILRDYRPGDINILEPDTLHRIDLLERDCWSLFLAGEFAQPWSFAPRCEG